MEWIQSLFSPRCILCGKRGTKIIGILLDHSEEKENLGTVTWVEMYGLYLSNEKTKQWSYHPSCVQEVLCKPETYGHAKVDLALEIINRKDDEKKRKEQERLAKLEADLQRKTTIKAACKRIEGGHISL